MNVIILNASQAVANIAEVMPYLLGAIALSLIIYIGVIVLLIRSKTALWRILALSLAFLILLIGVKGVLDEGNDWGMMNIIFFVPIIIGLLTEYHLRKNRPVS